MNRLLSLCRMTLLLVLLPGAGTALAAAEVPAAQMGATTVSAREASALLAHGARAIDVRSQHDFLEGGRLPGALHVAYRERSLQRADFDPTRDGVTAFLNRLYRKIPDPATPLVVYCNGIYCWKSFKALRAANDNGYRKLYWLRGGMAEWRRAGLPVENEE